jgi:predicted sulfurtransferase
LRDKPKDTAIFTYCTGGIRCIKVNSYLKQELGFHNIKRLNHGIIGYNRWIHENNKISESKFSGDNFLFDRRRL